MENNTTAGDTGQQNAFLTFEERMDFLRIKIKELGAFLLEAELYKSSMPMAEHENGGEIFANMKLAYRHLEDASMRIGKVKQHLNGGVSIYDKNVVGSPE